MFTFEITVHHSTGDGNSFFSHYKMPYELTTVDAAQSFRFGFMQAYKNYPQEIHWHYKFHPDLSGDLEINGTFNKVVSTKIVLVEDFKINL